MKPAIQALILLALALPAFAVDVVVPIDSVKNNINVRMEADAKTEIVGRLSQGDSLPFVRTIEGWHEVRLADDAYGFVSADWSIVISEEDFSARRDAADEPAVDAIVEVAVSEDDPPEADAETATVADVEVDISDEVIVDQAETEVEESIEDEVVSAEVSIEKVVEAEATVDEETTEEEFVAEAVTEEVEDAAVATEPNPVESATNDAADESMAAVASTVDTATQEIAGPGPQGPVGLQGPAGPPGAASVEGTEDFLMKFVDNTVGGDSQIFDDGRNVGIGTTQPKQRLEVNGNIQIHERNSSVAGLMLTQSSGETGYIMHNRTNTLTLGAGSVDRMTIDGDGNVGIGMTRPSHPIEMASGAYVSAGGVWTNSSSREKKENIVALTPEEALAALVNLQPVRFNYKQDDSEEYIGFIAEDVPSLVASSDRVSLSSMDIVAVLTLVVQQQQQKIAELEARLDSAN